MKILILHNYYKQVGGEDYAVTRESALLEAAGHKLSTYFRRNQDINQNSLGAKIVIASKAIWARDSYYELRGLLKREKPDLVHFHNTFPLISPSACYACREAGIPAVLTLHNYRFLCAPGTFFRDGNICEECLHHNQWRAVRYRCYRDSHAQTAAAALASTVHRKLGTWTRLINCYIAPTDFVRNKFAAAGFPLARIVVKPNFVDPDPGQRGCAGDYALFVGRMTREKGLRTLIAAWATMKSCIPLVLIGDGPLRSELERDVAELGLVNVVFRGSLSNADTMLAMRGAKVFVFPSEWYETFGLTIAEAFACGLPVLCSNFGAMAELVADGRTGLHFKTRDPEDLAAKVEWAWSHPSEIEEMGRHARSEYEAKYTPAQNYSLLMKAYSFALTDASGGVSEKLAHKPETKIIVDTGKV